ncbi:hypothetical protein [Ammoniphilus sp. CFH 90114]|uniref:hypothetical protein n=1 Tax=Ammoniphilus sp. CFH 90114 TaxID=2493665 RepID=UPI00100E4712|nr:hypothetical protein [Ammoniphilus sp. CFH 90114]RXT04472.1 hypothetical protein EIZ39_19825 [Ammoniphilus sp. CFH 90114]
MLVKLLGESFIIPNEVKGLEQLFKEIGQLTRDSNLSLSSMIIDGIEVFEDYNGYIHERIESIQIIEVVLQTIEEMGNQILKSTADYLERAIPELNGLSDEFYQGPNNQTWGKFEQFLEGLQWISDTFSLMKGNQKLNDNLEQILTINQKVLNELAKLEEAVSSSDFTLVGDILTYEIVPLLEQLLNKLKTSVVQEV